MHADAAKLIWDAQQALQRIKRFVASKDFAAYQSDELLRSAVERQFEILGEALNQLSRLDPDMAEKIPELPRGLEQSSWRLSDHDIEPGQR